MKITDERKGINRFEELKNCDVFLLKSSDESVDIICMKATTMDGRPKCINLENGVIGTLEGDRYVEPLDAELIIRG